LSKKLGDLLGEGNGSAKGEVCGPSLKIWIVSLAEETQSSVEVMLNDMLKMRDGIEPLRN